MAPAIVQAIKVKASTGTSVTLNNAWTVTALNTLHAFMNCWGAGASANNTNNIVSSDVNGTWTFGTGAGSNNAIPHGSQHYKLLCAGGLEDLTANGGTQVDGITAIFHEISGAPILVAGELASSDSGGATTNPQTGSETNSIANAIYLVSMGNAASNNPATATLNGTGSTPSSGWALFDATNSVELNGTTAMVASVAFLVASTSSARAHGWTTGSFRANDHIIAFGEYVFLPVFCCGGECGQAGSVGQHWLSAGTVSFSTTTVRNGARSLRSNPTAGTGTFQSPTFGVSNFGVIRVAVRFATLPSANCALAARVSGSQVGAYFNAADSKIYAGRNVVGTITFGATGVSVTTGVWYVVEVLYNLSANPHTVDVKVDTVSCGQHSHAVAATTENAFFLGTVQTVTQDVFFDDIAFSQTLLDYPIGDGYVNHFVPTSDGTHNVAGAADFRRGDTTTDITNATTTAFQLVDDVPLDDVTPDTDDHIRIVAPPNASDYVELVFGPAPGISTPTVAPRAVEVIAEVFAAGTGLSDEQILLNDNGTTAIIYNGTQVAGVTTGTYKRAHFAIPPSVAPAWTVVSGAGNFNDIRARYGFASDANPDKSLMCIMIEAEFAIAAPSNVQPPRSMHQFRLRRAA